MNYDNGAGNRGDLQSAKITPYKDTLPEVLLHFEQMMTSQYSQKKVP